MVKIRKNLVSSSIASKVTYGGTNSKKYIVIHETANTSKGADADAHGRLQANGNSRSASWHYTVDDKEIVQSFSDNAQCWHAGSSYYNKNGIGIEICVNSDGNFKKAVDNAAELTKYLMNKYNIPASNVVQHNTASGKDCPRYLRSGSKGVTWSQFKNKLTGKANVSTSSSKSSSKKSSSKSSNSLGLVDWMKSQGMDSSFSNRKKLAQKHGINGYKGTASQNIKLLNILKSENKSKKANSSKSKSKSKANLKVDGKWGKSTTKALQKALGLKYRDGILSSQPKNSVTRAIYGGITWGSKGSPTVRALQRKVKASADGKLGPATIRQLQKHLGTPVDGKLSRPSSMVVKELQRRLNKGTF